MVPEIRPARGGDAERLLALQRLCYRGEAELYGDPSIPPLTQTLESLKHDLGTQTVLVACVEGDIVGSVRAEIMGGTCHVGRLIVHPRLQRRGLGARLMREIEGRFPTAIRYELFTGHRSEDNLRFYGRLGYAAIRREPVSNRLQLVYLEKLRS